MKRLSLAIVLVLIAVMTVSAVQAQEKIGYGQVVEGEITKSKFEIEYQFTGKAGDILIIHMKASDNAGTLNSPDLILLDADNEVIADTSSSYGYQEATLPVILPANGDYILLATRQDGRTGDTVGKYTLEIIQPTVLKPGEAVTGKASSSDKLPQYYVVTSDTPFSISYEKTAGDYTPEVAVNTIDSYQDLTVVGALVGSQVESGMLGQFDAGTTYFIAVGDNDITFMYYFDEVTADYSLTMVTAS